MGRFRERVKDPLLELLRQGLSPRGLAWSLAAGVAIGIIPLFGTSTGLCVAVAMAFRLNQPAMQLANYLAYPLQLLLLLPFIRLGERLFSAPHLALSLAQLQLALRTDAWGTVQLFWTSLWHASVAWLLVVPVPVVLVAWGLTPLFRQALKPFRGPRSPDRLS
jgi:uncharacterized protein (DUF2062 family)